jgi:signal transduction histidine kinase
MRISITLRVALLVSLLAIASSIAVVGFIYLSTADDAARALRSQVTEEASAFREVYQRSGRPALEAAIRDAAGDPHFLAAITDGAGRSMFGDVTFVQPPARLRSGYDTGLLDPTGPPAPVNAGYVLTPIGHDAWLLSGRSFDERLTFQQTLTRSLLLALMVALLTGTLCGLLVAHYVGRRVAAIGATARRIASADFSHRVTVMGTRDPFDRLAVDINHMLDRIAALMNELRLLTDCLAHDLRSPVSRLRARVEAALAEPPERRDALLSGVVAETDSLMRILSTVLEIGRSEAMTSRDQFEWIDPGELIDELAEMYEPLAEDEGARLSAACDGPVLPLFGHRQLLAQALSNLIDNALKYGLAGGAILLSARQEQDQLRIEVADNGPGIAADRMAEALRRFGRLDQARQPSGAGLGLSLVAAVAHLHDGELELSDSGPGLRAALVFPTRTTGVRPPPPAPAQAEP